MTSPSPAVFEFNPAVPPTLDRAPSVVWASPGSMFVDDVASMWSAGCSVADLSRISGPWAMVLWQPKPARWVIAHDPVGVQPLFWARTTTGSIAVSSWVAALVDRPDIGDAPDYDGVLLGALGNSIPEVQHRTYFSAVSRVPWGHAVSVDPTGAVSTTCTWNPQELEGVDRRLSLADCSTLLREAIDKAVERLVVPGVPTAAHVSGGIDCSTMACRANQVLRRSGESLVRGYSWAPDERVTPRFEGDERSIVEDVGRTEGFPVDFLYADETGDWFTVRDPLRYPNSTLGREAFVLPRAAELGVRVMFSGWGGDELASFNGRNVMRWLMRNGRVSTVWSELRHGHGLAYDTKPPFRDHLRGLAGVAWDSLPAWAKRVRDPKAHALATRQSKDRRAAISAISPYVAEMEDLHHRRMESCRTHHDLQMALLMNGHMQQRCTYWHQSGELFGISYRYPLLDVNVVSTALRLPWWAFKSQGWTRIAYRMAVEPWVPPTVVWNPRKVEPALIAPPITIPVERSLPAPVPPPIEDPRIAAINDVTSVRAKSRPTPRLQKNIDTRSKGVLFRPHRAPRIDRESSVT